MNLTDSFGRQHTYLRIAVTDRCNLHCGYCMPGEGVAWRAREEILTLEEIVRVARVCTGMEVTKIRLTGGEPTVRRDLDVLIRRLADLPGLQTLGLTTNGVLLAEHARRYRNSGLTHLNISLDSLRRERFFRIARVDALDAVLAGIDAALEAGFRTVKINTVVMAGVNDDELLDFVEFVRERPLHLRFIEFMPFKGNGWSPRGLLAAAEMQARIRAHYPLDPVADIADHRASATEFGIPGFAGTIGFITPMSDAFCRRCSRLRLTADGSIKSCLFFPAEVNLRDLLRAGAPDAEIAAAIRTAVAHKAEAHPPAKELQAHPDRPMSLIGG